MDNILGVAKSYLEEAGIDTSSMLEEEILDKYYEMLLEEEEIVEDIAEVEEVIENSEEVSEIEDNEEVSDIEEVEEVAKSEIDEFIEANSEVIETLNEEQSKLFNELLSFIK